MGSEKDWKRWRHDELSCPLARMWRDVDGPRPWYREVYESVSDADKSVVMRIFGGDVWSVQRDGLFYSNALETLKNSPTDATADGGVGRAAETRLRQRELAARGRGPPLPESPLSWRRVLDWLLKLLDRLGGILPPSCGRKLWSVG